MRPLTGAPKAWSLLRRTKDSVALAGPSLLPVHSKANTPRNPATWCPCPNNNWLTAALRTTVVRSDKDTKLPDFLACWPSNEPVVEKAQQEPHCPWFFTAVTMPLVRQSMVSSRAAATSESSLAKVPVASILSDCLNPFIFEDTSVLSISEN